jgi:hypothetical protein
MASSSTYIQLTLPFHGEFENTWEIPVNQNFIALDTLFAPTTLAGGHSHSGAAGQGPAILHADLQNSGTNTHTQIDTHIADSPLHSNTQVSEVSGDHADSPSLVTVTDVSRIRFTNALVVDEGSGVVMVTLAPQTSASTSTAPPESAPISWTDNFNWPSGRPISTYGWNVKKSATPVDEQFIVQGPSSSGSGDHAELSLVDETGSTPQQGYVVSHAGLHLPHGITQRVTLDAAKLQPSDGLFWQQGDDITLTLDLMSANKGGDFTRPAEYGLSMSIRKPAGSLLVSYSIRLKPHPNTATFPEVVWTDFSGNLPEVGNDWQNLSPSYMRGTHEFSMRRHTTQALSFYLSYYYNGGLVFTKAFDEYDANPTVALFIEKLQELQANLAVESNPKQPVFGHMGFSTGWSLPVGREFDIWLRNFSATSQGDLNVLGIVALGSPPATDNPIAACAGGEYADVFIGEEFDFDGPTTGLPSSDWIITSKFAAGVEGSQNGAGFYIQNQSTNSIEIAWCDSPISDTVVSDFLVSRELNQTFEATGINLPTGNASEVDIEFVFGTSGTPVPVEWEHPAATGGLYSAGATVPASFLIAEDVNWDVDGSGKSRLTFTYSAGDKLPWGARIDAKINPRYFPFEESTFSDILEVVPGIPSFDQVVNVVWDDYTDPVNPVWTVFGLSTLIPEGSTIFTAVVGPNIPLGANFWSNGFYDWGFADVAGSFDAFSYLPASSVSPLWDKLSGGALIEPVSAPVVGYPPDFTASPDRAITSRVTINGSDSRIVAMAITRLAKDQYDRDITERGLAIEMSNPSTGEVLTPGLIILPSSVIPRLPLPLVSRIAPSPLANPTVTAGAAVGIEITGKSFDTDPTVVLGSGWVSPGRVYTLSDSELSIVTNADRTRTVTLTDLTIGPTANESIEVSLRNTAAYVIFPSLSAATVPFGNIGSLSTPQLQGSYVGGDGSLKEDRTAVISVKVKAYDTGSHLTFTEPGASEVPFFRVNGITKNPVADPGDGFFEWTINVTTTELSGVEGTLLSTATIYLVNGNGNYTSQPVPVTLSTQPSLDGVGIGAAYTGSNNIWSISSLEPATRTLYFETTNATKDTRVEVLNPGGGGLVIEEPWVEIVAGQRYTARAHLLTGSSDGALVGFKLTKPSRPNATVLTNTLNMGIEFAIDREITAPPTWDTPPAEGHYSQFSISGVFTPTDGVGSNLLIEFLDASLADIVHVSGPVVINSASTTTIIGSVRFADDTAGDEVVVRVSHTDLSPVVVSTLATSLFVTTPVVPTLISSTMLPSAEGTTGTVLTINGTGLVPANPPTGRTALTYVYSYTSTGTSPALANISPTTITATQLIHGADINPGSAGQSINLAVNYLGGNTATFNTIALVTSTTSTDTDPLIGETQLWGAGTTDFTGSPPSEVIVRPNGTAILRVTGSGLNSANVEPSTGFYMEVVGEEFVLAESPIDDSRETPPGPGLTNNLGSPSRFEVVSLIQQTDTEIVAIIPATMEFANTRPRVRLDRPASHPDGAGSWDIAAIDDTGLGNARGVPAYGTTFRYGGTSIGPRMNVANASGITQLAVCRSLQPQMAAGFEDGSISLTVRLQAAQSTAPTIFSIPDAATGADFSNIQVSATANPLEYTITADLPDPGVGNTLTSPYDSAQSAYLSLRFSTGHIIAGGRLGATDWGSLPGHIDF